MAEGNGAAVLNDASFKTSFAAVQPLILSEWSVVEADALASTQGELDKVIELISKRTEHTRALVRKQLGELHALALRSAAPPSSDDESAASRASAMADAATKQLRTAIDKLEARARALASELGGSVATKAEEQVKKNLWSTLLAVLGFGFILGFILRGGGRGGRGRD